MNPYKVGEINEEVVLKMVHNLFRRENLLAESWGDDCALLNDKQIVSIDMFVEGVDFKRGWIDSWFIGYKSLSGALSDIAGMGAKASKCLLSMGISPRFDLKEIKRILEGALSCAKENKVRLLGGDISRTKEIVLDWVVIGNYNKHLVKRSGARIGDGLYLIGKIGLARAGLILLKRGDFSIPVKPSGLKNVAVKAFLMPNPLLKEGVSILPFASAMMDISDGLMRDLPRLCKASSVGAIIFEDLIPIEKSAKRIFNDLGLNPLMETIYGGEDFALLVAIPEKFFSKVSKGIKITRIGKIVERNRGIRIICNNGRSIPLPAGGFDHLIMNDNKK